MPEPVPRIRRRWFRFSLRTLLVLITVLGLLLGWIVEQRRQSERETEIAKTLHAQIGYCVPLVSKRARSTSWWWIICYNALGPRIDQICTTSWSDLSPVAELHDLRTLRIDDATLTSLQPLSDHRLLERLLLCGAPVEDLSPLTGCWSLKVLNLEKTKVADISALSRLYSLEKLTLSDTQVLDLTPLEGLRNLRTLEIFGTHVSRQQIDTLKKALPNCDILHD